MDLRFISYDCWSVVTSYFRSSSTVFNTMMVSQDIYNVFCYTGLCFCQNVNFSLWPFEKYNGEFIKFISEGKEISFVINLSIGPIDILQRRLLCKPREKESDEKPIFNGIPSHDDMIIQLIMKKFPRLKKMEFSSFFRKNFLFNHSNLIKSDLEELCFVHPYSLVNVEDIFVTTSQLENLKTLKLKLWNQEMRGYPKIDFKSANEDGFKELENLEYDVAIFNHYSLGSLKKLKSLTLNFPKVYLCYGSREDEFVLEILNKVSSTLETLILNNLSSQKAGEIDKSFKNLECLKSLSFRNVSLRKENRGLSDSFFLNHFKKTLKRLEIVSVSSIRPEHLIGTNLLENLTDLSLYRCYGFGDKFFLEYDFLQKLSIIRKNVHDRSISKNGFKTYQNLVFFRIIGLCGELLAEEFMEIMFKNNKELDFIVVNKCDPKYCEYEPLPFCEFEKCKTKGCHSIISRSMMLSKEEEKPRKISVMLEHSNIFRWKIPNCLPEYWPFQACPKEGCKWREIPRKLYNDCGRCSFQNSGVLCCWRCKRKNLCPGYIRFEGIGNSKTCEEIICPNCGKKCEICSLRFCSVKCLMVHKEKRHKLNVRLKRYSSSPSLRKKEIIVVKTQVSRDDEWIHRWNQ